MSAPRREDGKAPPAGAAATGRSLMEQTIGEPMRDAFRWLHGRHSWALAILLCVAIAGRAYHRLDHPQMWAEDGRNWYADAHNGGAFATLFEPYAGYLHLLPRLLAWLVAAQPPAPAAGAIARSRPCWHCAHSLLPSYDLVPTACRTALRSL